MEDDREDDQPEEELFPKLEEAVLSGNLITGTYLKEIYTSNFQPIPYTGAVAIKRIQTKGWGLVSTSMVAMGDLLLVSEPVAMVQGQSASNPQLSDLGLHLQRSLFAEEQRAIIQWLYTGKSSTRAADPPLLAALSPWAYPPSDAPPAPLNLPPEDILGLIQHNAFGDTHPDLLVSTLRRDTPHSLLGIWPEPAMINHSCAPNAVQFSIAGRMLVRAAQDIAYGEEITLNYLGRDALLPAAARQSELGGNYGFRCRCPRCRMEGETLAEVGQVVEAVGEMLEELQPVATEALVGAEEGQLLQLQRGLQKLEQRVEKARREAGAGMQDSVWLRSSVYDLYQLQALVQERLKPKSLPAFKAQAQCIELAAGTVPGSDLHALAACKFVSRVQSAYQRQDPRVVSAQSLGFAAIKARYGSLDAATLRLMVDEGARLAQQLDEMAMGG